MQKIQLSSDKELVFLVVPECAIDFEEVCNLVDRNDPNSDYIDQLMYFDERFTDPQYVDLFRSGMFKYTFLGTVGRDGEANQDLTNWGHESGITKDFVFGLMATNGIYLPMEEEPKFIQTGHIIEDSIEFNKWMKEHVKWKSLEESSLPKGSMYVVLLKEKI